MSLKKNISGGALDVPLLGRQVEADEVVEVPDFQPDSTDKDPLPIIWPPDKWEPVADKPAAKASAKADDTSGKAAT
ncbi:MAG TPA: hypothetical protein VK817_00775 [Trebonia sp.]|jgi:hypothetical protein|nr:hypothetical protein [Trebonia sp.]